MSAFSEMVAADAQNVFLNTEEFGERHTVEGHAITAVVATNEQLAVTGGEALGIDGNAVVLYAQETDMPENPGVGGILNLDGSERVVEDWNIEMGVVVVRLRRNEAYA
ncbi:sugar ABC transporter ATP-binding protein [Caproicibacterium amylolyticum]|uniref:Sugar ABC transporter ATP-binding protein n=1 Tax=Caproicibacterium amylolyticum TaxID=2766537 RepID=A0A7G9WG93_9FIRM|nr:sugar ABC transporter ATP-binding protein [Caproicibacterium amylolyticum]QNO17705.1 sugar ABC transporter ATP-binding protein [Caproicibacterium amylolyticum]